MKKYICDKAKKCGGCQLLNMNYRQQLSYKQVKVIKLLGKFCHVDEIIGMTDPYHYRNKIQAAFGTDRSGRVISGIYQSSSHKIVPVDSCMIEDETADKIIVYIRKMLKSFGLKPYNEDKKTGFLRHVLVKRGFKSSQIMVVLVTASPMFPYKKDFVKNLIKEFPSITTVIQNINPGRTSLVLGEKNICLFGKGYIEEQLCEYTFRISAKSFYQINPVQTEVLYKKAIEFAGLSGKEIVIDAYCGTGTIGIFMANHAKQVIGVETNSDAVKDALVNAKINNVENIKFVNDDAGIFMSKMAQKGEKADVVVMDPPRAGSDKRFLASVVSLLPKKIVYISCNPLTQTNDIFYLVKHGYKVRKIQPVDMFPHTNHVETVALLSYKN